MIILKLDSTLATPRKKPIGKVEIKYMWEEMNKTRYTKTIDKELN